VGCLHHRYIKACYRRPWIDRALKKNTHIADDHAQKLPEASVSLKSTVFKLCCPAHLFPNTSRIMLVLGLIFLSKCFGNFTRDFLSRSNLVSAALQIVIFFFFEV
jgi:hypothetical protein